MPCFSLSLERPPQDRIDSATPALELVSTEGGPWPLVGSCRVLVSFFFQAEDGIRDIGVTGVQTCALPISEKLPELEFAMLPASHRYVTKRLQECNWAHSIEGALDTAHFSFLHMPAPSVKANTNPDAAADERRLRWLRNDPLPEFSVAEHEVGFVVGGSRRAEDEGYYWRLTQFMVPAHSVTPSALPGETYYAYTWVPITDEACWIYTYAWHPDRPLSAEERAKYEKGGFGQFAVLGPGFVPVRNRSNDFLIDREEQKHKSFTGVRGVAEQDAMAQASQGVIADRTREHLTPTDIGVVRFRRIMLDAAN